MITAGLVGYSSAEQQTSMFTSGSVRLVLLNSRPMFTAGSVRYSSVK